MAKAPVKLEKDVSIVLCGQAGQGLRTAEKILTGIMKSSGCHVFSTKEYMSRIRGGMNSFQLRISSGKAAAPTDRIDILVVLEDGAIEHMGKRVSKNTIVIGEDGSSKSGHGIIRIPLSSIASEKGDGSHSNAVAIGAVCAMFGIGKDTTTGHVREYFSRAGNDVSAKNADAASAGYDRGAEMANAAGIELKIKKDAKASGMLLLSGAEAVSLGAIAGNCRFISAYPMSPSTGILVFLSRNAAQFGIAAEQAEDEISAINMAIGAWYAGARAMVTTSGGGFALMGEGVSLSGMLETPVVVHLGQRPGPATGLPTRTEQGDLELVLHSGHGEFPRIVLAPGSVQEAFSLTAKAFDMADRYQTPVFILTDQSLLDSYQMVPSLDLPTSSPKHHFIKTRAGYRRYASSKDGISPRGIPGFGSGLVCVDSDEHDEEGHITEDFTVRKMMVEKRQRKMDMIKRDIAEPSLIGAKSYENLVVCWGSNLNVAAEALARLGRKDTSLLHFSQVYPLHPKTLGYLEKAGRVISVENNSTGQFANLIRKQTGFNIERMVLKYNGLPFSVEELAERIREIIRGKSHGKG